MCNQMFVPYNQLVHMGVADDATDNLDTSTLRTVSNYPIRTLP
jgi:hypothetical protein